MTTVESDAARIFADAQYMYNAALDRIAAGDIRDAAEKAWCATIRATEALILARTGDLPPTSSATTQAFLILIRTDGTVERLRDPYFARQAALHGRCFYDGVCEPVDQTERMIRQTSDFIADARRLAGGAAL